MDLRRPTQDCTDLLTTSDLAEALGLTPSRIIQLAREYKLSFISTRLGRLYPVEELERVRAERAKTKTK